MSKEKKRKIIRRHKSESHLASINEKQRKKYQLNMIGREDLHDKQKLYKH